MSDHDAPPLQIRRARGFWQRFTGLMFTRGPGAGHAFLLPHCACVHSCFMRAPLDLVYLDGDGVVRKLVRRWRPWRISWGGAGISHVLELDAGGVERHQLQIGQRLLDGARP